MTDNTELSISDAKGVDIQLQESNLDWKAPGKLDVNAFHKELERINKLADMEAENVPQANEIPVEVPAEETEERALDTQMDQEVQPVQEEQDDDDDADLKVIPKKRLNKEIEKRKTLEAALDKEREERIRYQTELELYNKAMNKLNAAEEQKAQEIDPVDEQAHNLYMRKINELEKKLEAQSKLSDTNQYERYFANAVNMQQAEFVQKQPDFDQAYKHLVDAEISTAQMLGANEQEAQQLATQKLYNLAQAALTKGQNVAEMFYKISKNYGYQAKAAASSPPRGTNLGKVEQNMRASASAAREVPGVMLKPSEDVGIYAGLDRFDDKFMNPHGRGVDPKAFHDVLRKLQGGM
jgi:hypothetical protein